VKLELKKDEKNISEKAIVERLVNDSIVRIVEFYKDGTFKEYLPK
jgi:hypothetical protein